MSNGVILVVEDKLLIAEDIKHNLEVLGYTVPATAISGSEAIEHALKFQPDLILMDIRIKGDIDGIEAAGQIRSKSDIPIIFLTAHSDDATVERARKINPYGYLLKPFEKRQLYTTIEMALNRHRVDRNKVFHEVVASTQAEQNREVDNKEPVKRKEFEHIVGSDTKILNLLERVELVAKTDVSVHIYGENGTGKELVADALHSVSNRSSSEFVKLNCSAIPGTLLESALFGHVKGAFTGANKDQEGFVEHAEGGTIFLDEIGDVSHDIQVKLLRLLQNREYNKVGESTIRKADIRILTATNKDLKKLVEDGKIREDFYYRINVFPIIVPPLRERGDDIVELADHFRKVCNRLFSKKIEGYAEEVLNVFKLHSWPGNIRELKNAIKHAFIMSKNNIIEIKDLPEDLSNNLQNSVASEYTTLTQKISESFDDKDEDHEKQVIIAALQKTKGNKTKAAELLGYSRVTLWKKMGKYDLETTIASNA